MRIVVISDLILARLLMIIFSLYGSIPEVPSSKSKRRGCFIKALARIILCFYPPERLLPFYDIKASRPPFKFTKSKAFVNFRH